MNYLDSWQLENTYSELPSKLYTRVSPTPVNSPKLIIANKKLAKSLGIDLHYADQKTLANFFSGNKYQRKII